jgi:hypothetical protein
MAAVPVVQEVWLAAASFLLRLLVARSSVPVKSFWFVHWHLHCIHCEPVLTLLLFSAATLLGFM